MKKIFLLPVLMLISSGLFAQFSWGVQAGANFANIKDELTDPTSRATETIKSNSNFGFTAGAVAEIPIYKSLALRPEVNFIQKNFNYNLYFLDMGTGADVDFILNYLELPVNLVYNFDLPSGKLFFGAGPNFSVGLSGKAKSEGEHIDIKFDGKSNSDINDANLHLEPLDIGLGVMAGQKLSNGIFASVGYTFGLSNISPDSDYETMRTKGFNVKIGYMIPSGNSKK